MAEAAIQITDKTGDIKSELEDIHQGLFGIMGMLRMMTNYVSKADDDALAVADVVEVMDQYIPVVDSLRVRLDAAIHRMK